MILRKGVTAGYIILEGISRHRERAKIRDWCLDNDLVIDEQSSSSLGKTNENDQTIIRFAEPETAMLCYLTLKE